MKKILILGAGLSTPSLIHYLLQHSEEGKWKVKVGDISEEMAAQRIKNHPNGESFQFDVFNDDQRVKEVEEADLVVSMLPARMHYLVTKTCVQFRKNMVTASYTSKELLALNEEAKLGGIILLNELGLDPGIDHMSAMEIIDRIKENGGELFGFKSSTGGLVAPRYDNNPWNYKFTWNPRNVVLAGQGGAHFIKRGYYKHIPYHKLFSRLQTIKVDKYGEFEVYPNRDSLGYRSAYGIENISSMFRGTIRRPGFSKTWNALVQLGATDDTYEVERSEDITYRQFINSFLRYDRKETVEKKLADYVGFTEDSFEMYKLRWLGIFDERVIGLKNATPAQILQKLLEEKWNLDPDDKDMIVMQHDFEYKKGKKYYKIISSMVVEGKDNVETAMALTVGLPLAIGCKLILEGKITATGVHIPTAKHIYEPILKELSTHGIAFTEKKKEIPAPNGD